MRPAHLDTPLWTLITRLRLMKECKSTRYVVRHLTEVKRIRSRGHRSNSHASRYRQWLSSRETREVSLTNTTSSLSRFILIRRSGSLSNTYGAKDETESEHEKTSGHLIPLVVLYSYCGPLMTLPFCSYSRWGPRPFPDGNHLQVSLTLSIRTTTSWHKTCDFRLIHQPRR